MPRIVFTMLVVAGLAWATPALGGDHWGFSFHSYAPAVPYYAPPPPPPVVYAYPPPYCGPYGYGHHHHHYHHRYVRPLPPPPPVWGPPPRPGVSLWLGF